MYFLYTDETNTDTRHTKFFVYAGVTIPVERSLALSERIEAIRRAHSYPRHSILKFQSNDLPDGITPDTHRAAKQEVLQAAAANGVCLLTTIVLHEIAGSLARAREYQINTACDNFNQYLHRIQSKGMVMVDNFTDTSLPSILREKFQVGLVYQDGGSARMAHIIGYHTAHQGASHFSSVVDIVLGSVRYVVNEHASQNPATQATLAALLQQLRPLWIPGSNGKVDPISLCYRPKKVYPGRLMEMYRVLHEYLAAAGVEADALPAERVD